MKSKYLKGLSIEDWFKIERESQGLNCLESLGLCFSFGRDLGSMENRTWKKSEDWRGPLVGTRESKKLSDDQKPC